MCTLPRLLCFVVIQVIGCGGHTALAQTLPSSPHQAERTADWLVLTSPSALKADLAPRLSEAELKRLGKLHVEVIRPDDRLFCKDTRQPAYSEKGANASTIHLCARSIYHILDVGTAIVYLSAFRERRTLFDSAFLPYMLYNAQLSAEDSVSANAVPAQWCRPHVFMYLAATGRSPVDCARATADPNLAVEAGAWLARSIDGNGPIPWDLKLLEQFDADFSAGILIAVMSHELGHLLNDEPQRDLSEQEQERLEINADLRAFRILSRLGGDLPGPVLVGAFLSTLTFVSQTSETAGRLDIRPSTIGTRVRTSAKYLARFVDAARATYSRSELQILNQALRESGFDPGTATKDLEKAVR